MKKFLVCILLLSMNLALLGGCGKQETQPLPVPDYPLEDDTTAVVGEEWGYSKFLRNRLFSGLDESLFL